MDDLVALSQEPKRKAKSDDVGWKWCFWHDLTNKDKVQCTLCGEINSFGVKRFKEHILGGSGDVNKCLKATPEIRREVLQYVNQKKKKKLVLNYDVSVTNGVGEDSDGEEVEELSLQESTFASLKSPSSGTASKKRKKMQSKLNLGGEPKVEKQSKSIASMIRKTPENVVNERHSKGAKQKTLEACSRNNDLVVRMHADIAKFFYENGLSFNVANSRSYEIMVESIAQAGPGNVPPSYHELRLPLLEKVVKEIDLLKERHMKVWKKYGCTLMADGWSDTKRRHLINFLANSPEGTFFLASVDASSEKQDAFLVSRLLEKVILDIGPENVVQIVSDNGSNFKKAGIILEKKYPTIYWTPCATHCINLMLKDIALISEFNRTVERGRKVSLFIYNHTILLANMREKLGGKELVRPGATRFATAFLTLESLYKHKDGLRNLFVSEQWSSSNDSRTDEGKSICDTILSSRFWTGVEECIRASHPLLVVLRIADAEEKPAMPELAMAMDCAKQNIRESFDKKARILKKVMDIVETHWSNQMGVVLYGAALFLNPSKYFDLKENDDSHACAQRTMFNRVLEKMVTNESLQTTIFRQVGDYDNMRGCFGMSSAIKNQKIMSPFEWWTNFGNESQALQKLALRIVGLCCSSSGCERNWSTFQFIHSKRRNKLEHKKLNDLVYVQYNKKIETKIQRKRMEGKNFNPLILEEFQWDNEWVTYHPRGESCDVDSDDNVVQTKLLDDVLGACPSINGECSNPPKKRSGKAPISGNSKKVNCSSRRQKIALFSRLIDEDEESEEREPILNVVDDDDDVDEVDPIEHSSDDEDTSNNNTSDNIGDIPTIFDEI